MAVDLNYRTVGEGRPVIILHGLFGSASNWLRIAKILSENCQTFLLDLRNHANSPHCATMSYEEMAEDLKQFIDTNEIVEPLIIGHSMGGKVAMYLALTSPEYLSKLLVVDIAPVRYHNRHQLIIDAMSSMPFENVRKRSDADEWLANNIQEPGLRSFILSNLQLTDGKYSWRVNLPVIQESIDKLLDFPEAAPWQQFEGSTLFIRGSESDYILDDYEDRIAELFPENELITFEKTGHWPQMDYPDDRTRIA